MPLCSVPLRSVLSGQCQVRLGQGARLAAVETGRHRLCANLTLPKAGISLTFWGLELKTSILTLDHALTDGQIQGA